MLKVYGTADRFIRVERTGEDGKVEEVVKEIGAYGMACRMFFTDGTEILIVYVSVPAITWMIAEIQSGPAPKLLSICGRHIAEKTEKDQECSDVFQIDAELDGYKLIDMREDERHEDQDHE